MFQVKIKGTTNHPETPVENADEHLHGSATDGEQVLYKKEPRRERDIGQEGKNECQCRQCQTDDGQILEMPSICLVAISVSIWPPLAAGFRHLRMVRIIMHTVARVKPCFIFE